MPNGMKLTEDDFCGLTREQEERIIEDMFNKGYLMRTPVLKKLWSAFDSFVTQFCSILFNVGKDYENENKDPEKTAQTQNRQENAHYQENHDSL